jgi:hypothetical protein
MAQPHPADSPAVSTRMHGPLVRLAASFAATTGLAIASVVWSES